MFHIYEKPPPGLRYFNQVLVEALVESTCGLLNSIWQSRDHPNPAAIIESEPKIAQGSTGSFNKCSKSSCTWQDLRLVEGRNGYHNRCQFSSMCHVFLCFYGLVKHHQSHPRYDSNSKYSCHGLCMSCFKKYIYRALIFQARGERAEAANDAWWKDISFYIRKLSKIISISFDASHMFGEMYNTSAYCKKFCFFC